MNRRQRRAVHAQFTKDITAQGCRCDPQTEVIASSGGKGLMVNHDLGCPLGDWVLEAKRRGVTPTLVSYAKSPGCQR